MVGNGGWLRRGVDPEPSGFCDREPERAPVAPLRVERNGDRRRTRRPSSAPSSPTANSHYCQLEGVGGGCASQTRWPRCWQTPPGGALRPSTAPRCTQGPDRTHCALTAHSPTATSVRALRLADRQVGGPRCPCGTWRIMAVVSAQVRERALPCRLAAASDNQPGHRAHPPCMCVFVRVCLCVCVCARSGNQGPARLASGRLGAVESR